MAWTAPATWSTSEVVVASKMNTHIRDNLNYLKGAAGAFTLDGAPTVAVSDSVTSRAGNTNAEIVASNTNNTAGSHYSAIRLKANDTGAGGNIYSAGRIAGVFQAATFADASLIFQTVTGSDAYQDAMTIRGLNVGIGATAPAGKLHVTGAGAVSGAGFAISS